MSTDEMTSETNEAPMPVMMDDVLAQTEAESDNAVEQPETSIETMALHKRITMLEEAFKKSNETVDKLAKGMGQAQQISATLINLFNQLNMRVSGLDPNVAVLEVTLVDDEPIISENNKEVTLKVAVHNKTHPEKPGQLDVLRLDKTDPAEPHWVPAAVTPVLSENIIQQLKDAGVGDENWQWIVVREIPRQHGQTALVVTGKRKLKEDVEQEQVISGEMDA